MWANGSEKNLSEGEKMIVLARKLLIIAVVLFSLLTANSCAQQKTTVTRIIDGDTLKVSYKGQTENIRLIGIDTPESRINKKTKKDAKRSGQDIKTIIAMGNSATEYVEGLVKAGDIVSIEFDVQERDRYGRLLGYVYLSNGKMLNEEIVKAGYANVMTIPPNVKYKDKFLRSYKHAREMKVGLW
jgi:micrococcal nuclease